MAARQSRSAAAGDEGPWRAGLIRHLEGEISLEEAAAIGRADTRHYAKRQFTWFRHQLPEFEWVKPEAARAWLAAALRSPDKRGDIREPG